MFLAWDGSDIEVGVDKLFQEHKHCSCVVFWALIEILEIINQSAVVVMGMQLMRSDRSQGGFRDCCVEGAHRAVCLFRFRSHVTC